jgi:hypothetical protein
MLSRAILALSILSGGFLLVLVRMRLATTDQPQRASFINTEHYADIEEPQLAAKLAHAEKLWAQSVKDRKTMAEKMGDGRTFPDGYLNPYNVWDFIRPSFFCPHDLERVGSLGDGGKIVCGMSRYEKHSPPTQSAPSEHSDASELIVYSFGVEANSEFEAAILKRTNAKIWGYDYSVSSWAKHITNEYAARASFSQLGIGGVTDETSHPPMFNIQDLMKRNGHTYIDILKMDIEGAEFAALTSLVDSIRKNHKEGDEEPTLPFGQLIVEIHFKNKNALGFLPPHDLASWLRWWSSLERMGLREVYNEHNWIGDVVFGKPRFAEYTMINVADKKRNKLLWA